MYCHENTFWTFLEVHDILIRHIIIDKMAFGMCKSLKEVTVSGDIKLAAGAFYGSPGSQLLPVSSPTASPTAVAQKTTSSSGGVATYIIISVVVGVSVIALMAAIALYFWIHRDCLIVPGKNDGEVVPLSVRDVDKDRAEIIRNIIIDALDLLQVIYSTTTVIVAHTVLPPCSPLL